MKAWRLYLIGMTVIWVAGLALSLPPDKAFFLKWMAQNRHVIADYYFLYVTQLGEPLGFIIIGILLWFRSWRKMLTIPILGLVVTIISFLLKKVFSHERPILYLSRSGWEGPMEVLDYYMYTGHASFPSGHSMAAWALFTLTAALMRKTWASLLCLFLAASVSISRVYLMVHFMRDVVAGALIGFVAGYMIYYAYQQWQLKHAGGIAVLPPSNGE